MAITGSGGSGSLNFIPLLGGVKYSFSEKLYGSGQLGLSIYTGGGGSNFTKAPGIGYQINENGMRF